MADIYGEKKGLLLMGFSEIRLAELFKGAECTVVIPKIGEPGEPAFDGTEITVSYNPETDYFIYAPEYNTDAVLFTRMMVTGENADECNPVIIGNVIFD